MAENLLCTQKGHKFNPRNLQLKEPGRRWCLRTWAAAAVWADNTDSGGMMVWFNARQHYVSEVPDIKGHFCKRSIWSLLILASEKVVKETQSQIATGDRLLNSNNPTTMRTGLPITFAPIVTLEMWFLKYAMPIIFYVSVLWSKIWHYQGFSGNPGLLWDCRQYLQDQMLTVTSHFPSMTNSKCFWKETKTKRTPFKTLHHQTAKATEC